MTSNNNDPINHPAHYTSKNDAVKSPRHYTERVPGVECKYVIAYFPYFPAAAMKYIWRAGLKDDIIQDYEKAIECLRIEVEKIKAEREGRAFISPRVGDDKND